MAEIVPENIAETKVEAEVPTRHPLKPLVWIDCEVRRPILEYLVCSILTILDDRSEP